MGEEKNEGEEEMNIPEIIYTQPHYYWKMILIMNSSTGEENREIIQIANIKLQEGSKITRVYRYSTSGCFYKAFITSREDILQ